MDFASIANVIVLIGAGVAVLIALIVSSVRRIRADERLVVITMGRVDSNERGPGTTFLVPVIDRGISVSLQPHHIEVVDVPATTADGRGVSADLDVRFRVIRPVAFVVEVPAPFPAGLRILARSALAHSVRDLPIGDALNLADVGEVVERVLLDRLAMAGTADVQVRMTRLRPAPIRGDQTERDELVRLGMAWISPDPDEVGSRTLAGDVAWAVRKVGRMARWGIVAIAVVAVGVQVLGIAGLQPWTPMSLIVGLFLGTLIVPLAEFRGEIGDVFRVAGVRRMILWLGLLAVYATATLGLVFVLLYAAGLDGTLESSP